MPHKSGYGGIGKNAGKSSSKSARRGKGSKPGPPRNRSYETSKSTTFEPQVEHVKSRRKPPAFARTRGKV